MILVHHGHIDHKAMRKAALTVHELNASLRAEGCTGPEDVLLAVLENNGHITVVPRKQEG